MSNLYVLIDFSQTFITSEFCEGDELIEFLGSSGEKTRSQHNSVW